MFARVCTSLIRAYLLLISKQRKTVKCNHCSVVTDVLRQILFRTCTSRSSVPTSLRPSSPVTPRPTSKSSPFLSPLNPPRRPTLPASYSPTRPSRLRSRVRLPLESRPPLRRAGSRRRKRRLPLPTRFETDLENWGSMMRFGMT